MRKLLDLYRRSLRFKLVLISVVIEITMLGLLLGNSLRLMGNVVEYHAQTLAQDSAPLLDGALSLVLFERNHASLLEIMHKLTKGGQSNLRYITVYDDQGQVYASIGEVDAQNMPPIDTDIRSAEVDGVFDTYSPLTLANIQVGEVRYGIDLEKLLSEKRKLFNQGLLIASTEVLLTIILLTIAGVFLTKHLNYLLQATRKVTAGDYSVVVRRETDDEIGELAEHFNRMTVAIRDQIQALRDSEQALFNEKERALVTLQSIGDGVITTTVDGRIELMNPVAEKLTGWKHREAAGRQLTEVFVIRNELTGRPVEDPVSKCLATRDVIALANHTLLLSKSGQQYPIEDSAAPIRDRHGEITGVVLVFHDVSGARHLARQMAYQARHDALTGLVNRAEFEDRLAHAIKTAQQEHREHAMFYMDLDQFKIVNDTCGHFAGDELLKQLAAMLKSHFRDSDTFARLGGDEFGVLLENCPLQRAVVRANELRNFVREFRFDWDGKAFEIGISIGLVTIDKNNQGMSQILSAADMACYIAKEGGRNRVHVHDAADEEHARRHAEMQIVSDINAALEEGRFRLYYQVIYPAQNHVEPRRHVELLLRMVNEQGESIPPYSFIPAAERFHLMSKIDTWVVKYVIDFIRRNLDHGEEFMFAINLSGASIAEQEFHDLLVDEITRSGIDPGCLCFEITETAAITNLRQAVNFIRDLKKLGCRFALDDFGSGLSSFAYLKNLHVDYLKIDGAFVRDVLKDETDAAMVEAINQIGHIMGLKTIAEYVESESILTKIKAMGVDYVQGYALHTPAPLEELGPGG